MAKSSLGVKLRAEPSSCKNINPLKKINVDNKACLRYLHVSRFRPHNTNSYQFSNSIDLIINYLVALLSYLEKNLIF